jgi:glutamate racemase
MHDASNASQSLPWMLPEVRESQPIGHPGTRQRLGQRARPTAHAPLDRADADERSGGAGHLSFSCQRRAAAAAMNILFFDSGLGGLTVFREVAKARPDARYVYVADDAFFPYNDRGEAELVTRVVTLMGELIAAHAPDLIVIACNTASTLVLPQLRERFRIPFVGTVPAIKPACAASVSKRVTVLGTQATVGREYTRALIRDFANGSDVALVGSARLAGYAEAELKGAPAADHLITQEIAPCFIDADGRRTDTIVLACTHYPLLVDRLARLAPWPVTFIDPAPAIARRVADLSGPPTDVAPTPARITFTSGAAPSATLAAALERLGLRA